MRGVYERENEYLCSTEVVVCQDELNSFQERIFTAFVISYLRDLTVMLRVSTDTHT